MIAPPTARLTGCRFILRRKMPRIRSVKPEFWTDEELAELSRDARLLYVGLWNFADEHSRMRGDPRYVKGQVFPYDDDLPPEAVDKLLDELASARKVRRYRVSGRSYLFLPNLANHQRLETGKVPSRLPGIDEAEGGADESEPYADKSAPDADESAPDSGETGHEPASPAATVRADKSARRADSSSLLYGAGSMEQGAGSMRERAGAHANDDTPPPPRAELQRPDGLTAIPDEFALTDAMRRFAAANFPQLDVDFETLQFISHYRSTGARRRSWPDQWQKWLRDSAKRRSERTLRAAAPKPSTTDQRVAQAQALKAEFAHRPPAIRGEVIDEP